MPIEYHIDRARRLVLARGHGDLTMADLFTYQRDVWSQSEVAGYCELVDMTDVQTIESPSIDQVVELATLSAAMDPCQGSSKFAIVAPEDLAFGLGRMYQAYRGMDVRTTKHVGVFRTLSEALAFLGMDALDPRGDDSKAPS